MKLLIMCWVAALLHLSVQAQTTRDWTLNIAEDELLETEVCQAWTKTTRERGIEPVELRVAFPTNGEVYPGIYVLAWNREIASSGTIQISQRVNEPLFLVYEKKTEDEPDVYWYAPNSQLELIDFIIRANDLQVRLNFEEGATEGFRFSLAGSAVTLRSTLRCLNQEQYPSRSFQDYLNAENFIEEAVLIGRNGRDLYNLLQSTFINFNLTEELKQAVEENRLRVLAANEVKSRSERLLNESRNRLTQLDEELNQLKQEQVEEQRKKAQLNRQLPGLEQRLSAAEQERERALAAYQPAAETMRPLEAAITRARSQRTAAQNALNSINSEIQTISRSISQRENQINLLQREITQLENQKSQVDQQIFRAESNLRNFNLDRRIDEILRNNFQYRNLIQREETLQSTFFSQEQRLRQRQSDLRQAQSALDRCRSGRPFHNNLGTGELQANRVLNQNNCLQEKRALERAVASGNRRAIQEAERALARCERGSGGGGSPGPRPIPPTPPPSQPPLDCSRQERDVRNAENNLRQAQRDLEGTQRQLDQVRREKRDLERRADDQARQELRQLQNEVSRLQNQRVDLMGRIDTKRRELATNESRLAQDQRHLSQLRADLSVRQADLQEAERTLRNAETRRNEERTRIGYSELKQAFEQANQNRDQATENLRQVRQDIRTLDVSIEANERRQAQIVDRDKPAAQENLRNQQLQNTEAKRALDLARSELLKNERELEVQTLLTLRSRSQYQLLFNQLTL